jgi:hypothetical protein
VFWTKIILAAVGAALAVRAGGAPTPAAEGPTDQVTVKAKWSGSYGSLPSCQLRQLVAWRKGNIRFARCGGISLGVSGIVEGRFADPDFLKRPVGVASLDIIPLDGAAAAVDAMEGKREGEGLWRLTRLPDGAYAILDVKDTPFAGKEADAEIATSSQMAKDLAAADPQVQYNALRLFRERRCPASVPHVLKMIGSDARVVVPDGMHWRGPQGGGVGPADSTLGREAAAALLRAARFSPDLPSEKDPPATWNAWWEGILKTEPFPKVVPDTVKSREVIALRLNQTWPEVFVSPDGNHAVVCATRLEQPIGDMRSGICFLDLSAAEAKPQWVYRVSQKEINREPCPVRVAWGKSTVGIVFQEFGFDEEKCRHVFLGLDYSGRETVKLREIPLKGAYNLALAADEKGWLLAYATVKGAVSVARLDDVGAMVGKPVAIAPDFADGRSHYHNGIETLSITAVDGGSALALDGDRGLFLALMDRELKLRATVQVDDAGPRHYNRSQPRVAWNGRRLLVAWIEDAGNLDERLYLRTFDRDGQPQCAPIKVAGNAMFLAPLVPQDGRFGLAWVDSSITPNQVRVAMADDAGKVGPITAIHDGHRPTVPIGIGVEAGTARALVYDQSAYPHRYLLKLLPIKMDRAP